VKTYPFVLLVLFLCMLAACSNAAPSVQPRVSASPTPMPVAISSALLGTYTTTIVERDVASHPELDTAWQGTNAGGMALPGTWILTFRSDGVWIAEDSVGYGRQYIGTGIYTVTQNQVTLKTDSKCLEYYVPYYGPEAQSATYIWRLSGQKLILQTVRDLCTPRKIVLVSHPWTRQS